MRKTLSIIGIVAALALPLSVPTQIDAQTISAPTLETNSSGAFLAGPAIDLLKSLSKATNWGVSGFGIYRPASGASKATFGGGAVALYNISPYVATGVGIDMLDNQTTMPSGQVQFQAPFRIGGTNGVLLRPFAFTGIATPISGLGNNNGSVVGLFGAGLGVKIYGGFNAYYAIEDRTGQPAPWHLLGAAYSASF
jgi:hypothetical protein